MAALALVSNGTDYFIVVNSSSEIPLTYTLISTEGKEIKSVSMVMGGTKNKIALDLSTLATAVYYIKINAGENYIAEKVLVK